MNLVDCAIDIELTLKLPETRFEIHGHFGEVSEMVYLIWWYTGAGCVYSAWDGATSDAMGYIDIGGFLESGMGKADA